MEVPIVRTRYATESVDEAIEFLTRTFTRYRRHTTPPWAGTALTTTSVRTPDLAVDRVVAGWCGTAEADPASDMVTVAFKAGGRAHYEFRHAATVGCRAGSVILCPPDAAYTAHWSGWRDTFVIRIPVARIAAIATAETGIPARELRFTDPVPISPTMSAIWQTTHEPMIRRLVSDDHGPMTNPLAHRAMVDMMATAVLTTFPNTTMSTDHSPGLGHVAPPAVRRAQEFIDAHASLPITVADIAQAAGVPVRALREAFRGHHDTTPSAYLRRARLDAARAELLATDPTTGASVASVAAHWGFSNAGHFTRYYRDTYGVDPTVALRG